MVLLAITGIFVVGLITMLLWNWLVPALFAGPSISLWQAFGLLLLSKLLFWGFGSRAHHERKRAYWRARCREKFSTMSAEDRELVKQKMKEKWCSWQQKSSGQPQGSSND